MGQYKVFCTESYLKMYFKLNFGERELLDNVKANLADNPVGKILKYSWFREKKFGNKRLYFLVDDDLKKVLIVAYGPKKEQNKTIKYVLFNINEYLEELKRI
jgi:mRNA-degrading endonuclease RelE of RelBE toxin-antitoxin system